MVSVEWKYNRRLLQLLVSSNYNQEMIGNGKYYGKDLRQGMRRRYSRPV